MNMAVSTKGMLGRWLMMVLIGLVMVSLVTGSSMDVREGRSGNEAQMKIISQMRKFHSKFRASNLKTLVKELYLPEAYVMPAGQPAIKGKEKILSMDRYFVGYVKDIKIRNEKIEIFGNIALEISRYELDGKDGSIMDVGKALTIWKKDPSDERWKILYDIWNKN